MELRFNVEKEERKALVAAIGEITDCKPRYCGAPGFIFAIGSCSVDRYGTVTFNEPQDADAVSGLAARLSERGFVCEIIREADGGSDDVASADETSASGESEPVEVMEEASGSENISGEADSKDTALAVTAAGTACDAVAEPDGNPGIISIDMPLSGFTASALDNLERLVAAKAWIIRKMTGADALPIVRENDCLRFPWFKPDSSAAETDAYSRLVTGLCETARNKQRVTATERRLKDGDNEKFKARCFLLSLNFIGSEYKQARSVLLAGFSGNGSHSTGNGWKNAWEDTALTGTGIAGQADGLPKDNDGEGGAEKAIPLRCGECGYHCYYTGGVMVSNAGNTADTSKREPHQYTRYCLGTPGGFRKIKHETDWSGFEAPPSWCPLRTAVGSEGVTSVVHA
jgi:hypothetical protein